MVAKNVKLIGVYETPDVLMRIRAAAKRDGLSVARWCRTAIRRQLKERENGKAA